MKTINIISILSPSQLTRRVYTRTGYGIKVRNDERTDYHREEWRSTYSIMTPADANAEILKYLEAKWVRE